MGWSLRSSSLSAFGKDLLRGFVSRPRSLCSLRGLPARHATACKALATKLLHLRRLASVYSFSEWGSGAGRCWGRFFLATVGVEQPYLQKRTTRGALPKDWSEVREFFRGKGMPFDRGKVMHLISNLRKLHFTSTARASAAVAWRAGRPRTERSEGGGSRSPGADFCPEGKNREGVAHVHGLNEPKRVPRAAGPGVRGCRGTSRDVPRPRGAANMKLKEKAAPVAEPKRGDKAFLPRKQHWSQDRKRSPGSFSKKSERMQNRRQAPHTLTPPAAPPRSN